MDRRTPTRLELHRLRYRWRERRGPLLQLHELESEERHLLAVDVFRRVGMSPGEDPYVVYSEVLEEWGVVCPHPQHMRRYSGKVPSSWPLFGHRWYTCGCCGCSCVNEDFRPSLQVGFR